MGSVPLGVGVSGLDLVARRGVHKGDLGVDGVQGRADGVHECLHIRLSVSHKALDQCTASPALTNFYATLPLKNLIMPEAFHGSKTS